MTLFPLRGKVTKIAIFSTDNEINILYMTMLIPTPLNWIFLHLTKTPEPIKPL